jgi:zinc transport system permease protein
MHLSILFGALFSITGLALSYTYDVPSGATIILVMSAVYMLHFVYKAVKPRPAS